MNTLTKASIVIKSHLNDAMFNMMVDPALSEKHIQFAYTLIHKYPNTEVEIFPETEWELFLKEKEKAA